MPAVPPGNANLNEILTTTLSKWLEKAFVDNVFKARVLFFMLTKNDNIRKVDGGANIIVPVLEGNNGTVMAYSQDEELRILRQQGMTGAQYSWAQAAVSITITGIEEAENRGESRVINLLEAKTEQAEESFSAFFNNIWFGKGTDAANKSALDNTVYWNGLGDIMDATVTTFGGILGHAAAQNVQDASGTGFVADSTLHQVAGAPGNIGADYPTSTAGVAPTGAPGVGVSPAGFWLPVNGTVAAPTSGNTGDYDLPTGKRRMRNVYNSISIGNDQPQVVLTRQDIYEQYEDSMVDQIRYTNTEMADAGFQNLMFKGCPITYDADQKAGIMDFLNFRYLRLVGHSDVWFQNTPFVRPNNRDARTSQILCYGQVVCMKRSALGRITWTPK